MILPIKCVKLVSRPINPSTIFLSNQANTWANTTCRMAKPSIAVSIILLSALAKPLEADSNSRLAGSTSASSINQNLFVNCYTKLFLEISWRNDHDSVWYTIQPLKMPNVAKEADKIITVECPVDCP